jgi:hypothetical protein
MKVPMTKKFSHRQTWSLARLIKLSVFIACVIILATQLRVSASGVAMTLSDGVGIVDGGSGGQTEIVSSWTTSGFYTTGTQVTFTMTPAASSTITDCTTPDTQFALTGDGSFGSFTSSTAIYTFSQNMATGTAGSLCLRFELEDATSSNYTVSMQATSSTTSFTTSDGGAALYYVLGGNEVNVIASVPSSLSFSIRNAADTGNTNVCQFGTLALNAVSLCSYRLRIATNAANGFTATVQPNGEFNVSGHATMTAIGNDLPFAAGTEAYGVAMLSGATSGGRNGANNFDLPAIEAGATEDASLTFNIDSTPLDFTSATTVLSFTAPFNALAAPSPTTTTMVVHGASVGAATPYGQYAQTVTYRVTGSY